LLKFVFYEKNLSTKKKEKSQNTWLLKKNENYSWEKCSKKTAQKEQEKINSLVFAL